MLEIEWYWYTIAYFCFNFWLARRSYKKAVHRPGPKFLILVILLGFPLWFLLYGGYAAVLCFGFFASGELDDWINHGWYIVRYGRSRGY